MRHLPFAIKTLPWSQYDALQLNGVNPLPINVASDSSLHQSRNSLPELIRVSSRCAIADDAIRTNSSDAEPFIVIPPSNRRSWWTHCLDRSRLNNMRPFGAFRCPLRSRGPLRRLWRLLA